MNNDLNDNKCVALVLVKWATEWELNNLKGIIYKIINLINGKCYIGKALNTFRKRYRGLKWWEKTHSFLLKRAIEKYGLKNFKVEILSHSNSKQILPYLEDFYATQFNAYAPDGYNIIDCLTQIRYGDIAKRNKFKTYLIKEIKTGKIIEINNLNEFCISNKIKRNSLGSVLCGVVASYRGYCLPNTNISEIEGYKTYELKDKNNKIHKFVCVKDFCNKNTLNYQSILNILNKRILFYKDWSLPETPKELKECKKFRLAKVYFLKNPENKIIRIFNMRKFCRDNNLSRSSIKDLLKDKITIYKGWIKPKKSEINYEDFNESSYESLLKNTYKEENFKNKKNKIEYTFISNEGIIIVTNNLSDMAKKFNLDPSSLSKLVNRKMLYSENWKFVSKK